MTEPSTTSTASEAIDAGTDSDRLDEPPTGAGTATPTRDADRAERIRRNLTWAALGVCSLIAVVAVFQFYLSVGAIIDDWVADAYQPIVSAAFNLVVLLLSLAGISWIVRELH